MRISAPTITWSQPLAHGEVALSKLNLALWEGWGKPARTLVSWRQGFKHPTKNECMVGSPKSSGNSWESWCVTLVQIPHQSSEQRPCKAHGEANHLLYWVWWSLSELYVKKGFSTRHSRSRSLTKRSAFISHLTSTTLKLPSFCMRLR